MVQRKPDLILVRGLPGSGKSTLAKRFTEYYHVEADMFWGPDYKFDINRIKDAHEWCLTVTGNIINRGYNVIVSNTFITLDEMRPYFELAKDVDATISVVLCQNSFRNIHNVPDDTIEKMRDRFQNDVSSLYKEVFG